MRQTNLEGAFRFGGPMTGRRVNANASHSTNPSREGALNVVATLVRKEGPIDLLREQFEIAARERRSSRSGHASRRRRVRRAAPRQQFARLTPARRGSAVRARIVWPRLGLITRVFTGSDPSFVAQRRDRPRARRAIGHQRHRHRRHGQRQQSARDEYEGSELDAIRETG